MSIVCKQCGYENPDGAVICDVCAEELDTASVPQMVYTPQPQAAPVQEVPVQTAPVQSAPVQASPAATGGDDGREYFVFCDESKTKTVIADKNATSFFCEGCKKQHEIDGILWMIEESVKEPANAAASTVTQAQSAPKGDNLWLEEINSHVRIDIDKTGGTLGRYGTFGSEFFQSRNLLKVSGEHCLFTYQYGTWVIRHVSRTNQTMYNNMILAANEPTVLEDGKILNLANAVTFIVRIG